MATNGHTDAHSVDFTPLGIVERPANSAIEAILWFDIDNCLYSPSRGIAPLMSPSTLATVKSVPAHCPYSLTGQKIHDYFVRLGFPEKEAWDIHQLYYKEYGLAIRGLQQHHPNFDAEDFDRNCDGALPLEELLSEDEPLQDLLKSIDRSRVRVMALTNAHKPHALRVLGILGVTDLFEGVISCQYRTTAFPAKPDRQYYAEAVQISGLSDPSKHYFVDDSLLNVRGSQALGWNSWLYDEQGTSAGKVKEGELSGVVSSLQDLRKEWSQFFL